jgi:hypothetical protein
MGKGKGKVIGMARHHSARSSISFKSPVAALKISRAQKRGERRCAIIEAWSLVGDYERAA